MTPSEIRKFVALPREQRAAQAFYQNVRSDQNGTPRERSVLWQSRVHRVRIVDSSASVRRILGFDPTNTHLGFPIFHKLPR